MCGGEGRFNGQWWDLKTASVTRTVQTCLFALDVGGREDSLGGASLGCVGLGKHGAITTADSHAFKLKVWRFPLRLDVGLPVHCISSALE